MVKIKFKMGLFPKESIICLKHFKWPRKITIPKYFSECDYDQIKRLSKMKFVTKDWEECFGNNKSAITLNLEPLPNVSAHWPGVGKYLGIVRDDWHIEADSPWQKRRIYQDELDKFNKDEKIFKGKILEKSFLQIMQELKDETDIIIMTKKDLLNNFERKI